MGEDVNEEGVKERSSGGSRHGDRGAENGIVAAAFRQRLNQLEF